MNPTIGIFSRAGEEEYKWLIFWLRSESSGIVVRPFYVSNTNWQRFREEVSQCTVAILYHSKKRGRVNLTDVTDSLYDEELEYLSAVRGKANVFVVIDDLDDSDSEAKNRILTHQPKIRNLASDVFLFTREEKDSSDMHNSPKLNAMRELVNKGLRGDAHWTPFGHLFTTDSAHRLDLPDSRRGLHIKSPTSHMKIPDKEEKPKRKAYRNMGSMVRYGITAFTWWNTYRNPDVAAAFLTLFWTAAAWKIYCYPSKPLIPDKPMLSQIVLTFAGIMTVRRIYNIRLYPIVAHVRAALRTAAS
ncbi:uncharacterized protein LOC142463608 [Ascaphus truei]|uniref:uncharacterized protein LOC142463608 n=1 Tax=Ascaphus truei TaxID=8439 RepID=UPI003F5A3052